ncbi:hypothetical protein FACS189496_3020 [Bacilli bacterium]|nr:hypothetical protein FACS189496_3020 [Bacilli bacterium]
MPVNPPKTEDLSVKPYTAFGADFYKSTPEPIFNIGARTCGYLNDVTTVSGQLGDPAVKNWKSPAIVYVYAKSQWDDVNNLTDVINTGMYGIYNSAIHIIEFNSFDPWDKTNTNAMAISFVNPKQFSWFLLLNSDPINPLNP